jgi:hypothetical protein
MKFIKQFADLQINARESLRCERDMLGSKPIVRIIRMKPDAAGDLRPISCFEFAERHLHGVIAMLGQLASIQEARR